MPEFKDFPFEIGNFVSLEYYDNYYVNMRIISMAFNPCIPNNSLSISFSNFIKSKSERTDVSNILGLAVGSSSSSSSGGSGSGSGSFGVGNDIDITISNTMLSKLLNTEMFGTRVSNIILDTIKVNEITVKYAKFEGLAKGTTTIDGKCITTGYIIDQNYNGTNGNITNTKGSVINLETGKFNFGGGSLKYNGNSLTVKGAIYADSGYIGGESGFTIAAGKLYSNGHSSYNTATEGVYIGTDCISLGNGGVTYFNRNGTGKIGAWRINQNAIYRVNESFSASDGMYFGVNGLSIKDVFQVDSDGNLSITDSFRVTSDGILSAINANVSGKITADELIANNSGYIGGWKICGNALYKGTDSLSSVIPGIYLGINGIRNFDSVNANVNILNGRIDITEDGTGGLLINNNSNHTCTIRANYLDFSNLNSGGYKAIIGDFNNNMAIVAVTNSSNTIKSYLDYQGLHISLNDYIRVYNKDDCSLIGWSNTNNIHIGDYNEINIASQCYIHANNIYYEGSGGHVELSDTRYKKNISDINNGISFIKKLSPKSYEFTNGTSGRRHFGFLTSDIEKVLLETTGDAGIFVKYNLSDSAINLKDDSTYICGLRYTEFIAPIVQCIQDLYAENDKLKTEIASLKNKTTKEHTVN